MVRHRYVRPAMSDGVRLLGMLSALAAQRVLAWPLGGALTYNCGGMTTGSDRSPPRGRDDAFPNEPAPPTMTRAFTPESSRARLHERLSRETRAEVYFDRGHRGLYATD